MTGHDVLPFREYCRILYAERIVFAHNESRRATNIAEWTESNPGLAAILVEAIKLHATSNPE